MRLFLGCAPPDALREEIAAFASSLRAVAPELKWVDPSLYHLTLQFLGEIGDDKQAVLAASLAKLSARAPFSLRLGAVEIIPPGARGRVLALSVAEGFAPLKALAKAVMSLTRHHGVPREGRPYRAHLTLARTRRGERFPAALADEPPPSPSWPAWEVRDFHLFRSVLRPGGPVYGSRLRVELQGSEA